MLSLAFAKGPPKAWGVASVTYGPEFNNTSLLVNATGDSFGTQRAKNGLQNIIDYLEKDVVKPYNQTHSTSLNGDQQVGLIAQRMPALAWRASDAGDSGYKLTDIDALTGEQKLPYRRFDDNGIPFSSDPARYTVDPSDPNQRGSMGAALVASAYSRQAIAPMWEVRTAKQQATAGAVNAGLSEEERAAKAGLNAPLDSAYAASHSGDTGAKNKRVGSFMVVALDMNGDNTITTSSLASNASKNNGQGIRFNWDGQNFQKKVGWVGGPVDATGFAAQNTDGLLVLDKDFNQSVDNGAELLGNPLVKDEAKGLRSLATWDANGDGRIDQYDPVYNQLKVWQDFNQDGSNTHAITVNDATDSKSVLVQDEAVFNGQSVKELRSLQRAGHYGD